MWRCNVCKVLVNKLEKIYILDKSQSLFLANYKKMNTETYAGFRLSFLHSDNKKDFWNDCLFLNLYDFAQLRRNGFLLKTYKTKNSLLKRIIR